MQTARDVILWFLENADIACGNWGAEPGWTFIEINTKKGKELVENTKKRRLY